MIIGIFAAVGVITVVKNSEFIKELCKPSVAGEEDEETLWLRLAWQTDVNAAAEWAKAPFTRK